MKNLENNMIDSLLLSTDIFPCHTKMIHHIICNFEIGWGTLSDVRSPFAVAPPASIDNNGGFFSLSKNANPRLMTVGKTSLDCHIFMEIITQRGN